MVKNIFLMCVRVCFHVFEGVSSQEGLENAPEARGVILTEFGSKWSHLVVIQAHFYDFWVPHLCTCLCFEKP